MCTLDPTPRIICTDASLGLLLRQWLASQTSAGEVICVASDCSQAPLCQWLQAPSPPAEDLLHAALSDTIATLMRTRHAFKSRELGELRTRLERLLEELSATRKIE